MIRAELVEEIEKVLSAFDAKAAVVYGEGPAGQIIVSKLRDSMVQKLANLYPAEPDREALDRILQDARHPHKLEGNPGMFPWNGAACESCNKFRDALCAWASGRTREKDNVDTCTHSVYSVGWKFCPSCGKRGDVDGTTDNPKRC